MTAPPAERCSQRSAFLLPQEKTGRSLRQLEYAGYTPSEAWAAVKRVWSAYQVRPGYDNGV
jgi:hypothetical protein